MKSRIVLLNAFLGLSFVGVVLALYALAHETGRLTGGVCDINATFNCDVVNRGPYGNVGGVPVALIGVIGYAFFALAAFLKRRDVHDRHLSLFLLAAVSGGVLFTLYLTGVEAFVLHTWCLVCLCSQAVILSLFGLSLAVFLGERLESRAAQAKEILEEAADELKEL